MKRTWRRCLLGTAALVFTALAGVAGYAYTLAHFKAPSPTLLLYDRHGRFLAQSSADPGQGYGYWPLAKLPPRVVAATLALEDKRFWKHPGVDPMALLRAAWQDLRAGRKVSGASTIAMQVARMQNPGPRTFGRKLVESFTALFLTARYGRRAVLRQYLRLVPYANDIHGIGYAARLYLGKPVQDLSWAEIAFLAAIPQAPGVTNPFQRKGRLRAIRRGEQALDRLHARGVIDGPDYAMAKLQIARLRIPHEALRPVYALHAIIKLEHVLRRDRHNPIVYTSLDLGLQRYLQRLADRMLARWHDAGAQQTAVIVLRRKSRQVLAWLGSAGYFDSPHGAIDYAQLPRSPGSTLKPFVYAHALDRGTITPGTVLYDLPAFANGFSNIDLRYLGPMLPRRALANSRNVPATWLVGAVGLDETYDFLGRLGLHDDSKPADYYGAGMAIGTLPLSLEQLVRAYGVLADDGMLKNLVWVRNGKPGHGRRLLSLDAAREVSLFLSDPMARLPSFPRMGTTEFPFPVAIKTGTSQGYRDAWAVAYSRDYLVGVWVGRPDVLPMHKLGGAASAADLAQRVLMHLDGGYQGLNDLSFPPPPGYRPYQVCAYTGMRADGLCEPTLKEWFPASEPPPPDDRYLRLWGNPLHPRRAGDGRPHIYLKVPAFLRPWADAHHIANLPMDFDAARLMRFRSTERTVRLTLQSPAHTLHLMRNPDTPHDLDTLTLRVDVEPEVGQVVWYVDGKPYRLSGPPYTVFWPLQKGHHSFQARLPYRSESSAIVGVDVR
ncbi:MAG: transglycosylase domain-containing protein [Acidihalobacter sp.]|uniref:transglycosylase domain-containing protein n=1 Tax=Acidihalobacter sp. TaxID=1872108 RepID=UPI00307D3D6C